MESRDGHTVFLRRCSVYLGDETQALSAADLEAEQAGFAYKAAASHGAGSAGNFHPGHRRVWLPRAICSATVCRAGVQGGNALYCMGSELH